VTIWPFNRGESLRQPLPWVRLAAFGAVGLLCLAYLLFSVVGTKTIAGQYHVSVDMTATGGLFPGSQVTYRGVPIGTVSSIDIAPSKTQIVARLAIHDGVHLPRATLAVVADRSPAGEQYLDFQPTGSGPPYLGDGDTVAPSQTRLPPSLAGLLGAVASFAHSVNVHELRSVFNELDAAFGGTGPALGRLIDNSAAIVATLQSVEPQTVDLLRNAGRLLDTQTAHGADLHRSAVSLRQLADTLRADNPKTLRFITAALSASRVTSSVLKRDAGYLSTLLSNLVTTGNLVTDRLPGLRVILRMLPRSLTTLASAVHGGHVAFKLLAQTGRACKYKTRRQMPYVLHRRPPLYNAFCLHPPAQAQQRGAINAPRPPGDTTASPPSGNHGHGSARQRARVASSRQAHSQSWTRVLTAGVS
jgi:phospholipid/cholesterol/gamma-HCH transport system substrate-binding protein